MFFTIKLEMFSLCRHHLSDKGLFMLGKLGHGLPWSLHAYCEIALLRERDGVQSVFQSTKEEIPAHHKV